MPLGNSISDAQTYELHFLTVYFARHMEFKVTLKKQFLALFALQNREYFVSNIYIHITKNYLAWHTESLSLTKLRMRHMSNTRKLHAQLVAPTPLKRQEWASVPALRNGWCGGNCPTIWGTTAWVSILCPTFKLLPVPLYVVCYARLCACACARRGIWRTWRVRQWQVCSVLEMWRRRHIEISSWTLPWVINYRSENMF